MSRYGGDMSDSAILDQIGELAGGITDERTRMLVDSVVDAMRHEPEPIPRGILGSVLEAIALNPQPLPPHDDDALNPQPIPPGMLRTVLEAVALNPQPLPPAEAAQAQVFM